MNELRDKFKDLLFMPVHIDHQNVEPDEVTITKEGKEYYLDELVKVAQAYISKEYVRKVDVLEAIGEDELTKIPEAKPNEQQHYHDPMIRNDLRHQIKTTLKLDSKGADNES